MITSSKLTSALLISMILGSLNIFGDISLPKELIVSIGQIPIVAEPGEKGAYPDFMREMQKASGKVLKLTVKPFARSMNDAIKGKAHFHLPIIAPLSTEDLPYDLSTTNISKINFVIYSNKNNPISADSLEGKNLETDAAHTHLFPFEITPSTCASCSLKKVNAGRIDAFIFADSPSDIVIKKENFKNIRRSLYKRMDVKFVLPKGERGGAVDKFLTQYMQELRKNGAWQKYIYPYTRDYDDWQP